MTRRKKLAICNAVITHWMCNLMLAYAGEMGVDDRQGYNCAFCKMYTRCIECPLNKFGHASPYSGCTSEWDATRDFRPESCAAMLTELERVCDLWLAGGEAV
jgi:hypothetical protein